MTLGPFHFSKGSARCYIGGYRIHHGLTGACLVALGAVLIAHDWSDRPWPVRDH